MSQSNPSPELTPPSCCQTPLAKLKLYQAFIFSVPIFLAFVLLFLFYLCYLRRRRVDWSSLRMRATLQAMDEISACEMGLKKEHREMLPVIIFKESFSVKDTQCSVCLADYNAEDKLQQIPPCGHTFHMACIDLWLTTHTTCPLCRLSLAPPANKDSAEPPNHSPESSPRNSSATENGSASHHAGEEFCIETVPGVRIV